MVKYRNCLAVRNAKELANLIRNGCEEVSTLSEIIENGEQQLNREHKATHIAKRYMQELLK